MKAKQQKKVEVVNTPKVEKKQSINLYDKYFGTKGLLVLFSLLLVISLIVFKDFISGKFYYLFKDIGSDTINSYYPNFVLISDYLRSEGLPKWSFAQGLGQNIFPFSFADPLFILPYFIGRESLAGSIIYMELIKIFVGGFVFYKFLRITNNSKYASLIGTLMFSFSGFMILGGSWFVFSTEALYVAILLLSFELLFQKNKWHLFPIIIALISVFQPFDLYLYGLFLLFYAVFRFVDTKQWNTKDFSILLLKLAGLGAIGVLISGFFFINNILQLIDSPRVGGDASYFAKLTAGPIFATGNEMHNVTAIFRFFSNDLQGNGSQFHGWQNYLEAPIFYIGLISILLFSQVFFIIENKKKRILYGIILGIFILSVIFPFLRYSFWFFTGDYYRGFSFFVAFFLLFYSMKALTSIEAKGSINTIALVGTLIFLLILLYFPYSINENVLVNKSLQGVVRNFLILYAILIFLFKYEKIKFGAQIAIIFLLCFELGYFNAQTIHKREAISKREFNQKTGFNDYSIDATRFINSNEKDFFRVNKDYTSNPSTFTSFNDAKVQNYYGSMSYFSFNQKYYIRFLKELDILKGQSEYETRWALGINARAILQTITSTKYNLSISENPYFKNMGYDSIAQFGNVKVLKNKYFMPMGFTYDRYIPISSFRKLSTMQKDFVILKAFVAEEPLDKELDQLNLFNIQDTSQNYNWIEHENDIKARLDNKLVINQHNNNLFKGTINLDKPKMLFFSIPYDKGWKAKVDGKETSIKLVNAGFIGLPLNKGKHSVELFFEIPYLMESLLLSVGGLFIYFALVLFFLLKRKPTTSIDA